MSRIWAILHNFWFCLAMALWSLFSMAVELEGGVNPWISVICVVLWVYLAWRSVQRSKAEDIDDGEN